VHYDTLELLIAHLNKITGKQEDNKMTPRNLGVVWGPTLIKPVIDPTDPMAMQNMGNIIAGQNGVVEKLIENCSSIFGGAQSF
jgi:hypothetical protein